MMTAFGANLKISFEIRLEEKLATALALLPQALCSNRLLRWIRFNLVFLPLEPGHLFPFATRPSWQPLLPTPNSGGILTATALFVALILCSFWWE
jgi:hypothetical protein